MPETDPAAQSFRLTTTNPELLAALEGFRDHPNVTLEPLSLPLMYTDEPPLDYAQLRHDSVALWGTPEYGDAAAGVLSMELARVPGRVLQFLGSTTLNWRQPHPKHNKLMGTDVVRGADITQAPSHIELLARQEMTEIGIPCALVVEHQQRREPTRHMSNIVFTFKPGDVSAASLAEYMRTRRYNQHMLSGAFGKTLDVLNRTSGSPAGPRSRTLPDDTAFITPQELTEAATEVVTKDSLATMFSKINQALAKQLETGMPTAWGEVVIEGPWTVDDSGTALRFAFGSIALPSLAVVAASYKAPGAAKSWLQSLAESSA